MNKYIQENPKTIQFLMNAIGLVIFFIILSVAIRRDDKRKDKELEPKEIIKKFQIIKEIKVFPQKRKPVKKPQTIRNFKISTKDYNWLLNHSDNQFKTVPFIIEEMIIKQISQLKKQAKKGTK